MLQFGLRQAGRLALGLFGAVLLTAFVSAFAVGGRTASFAVRVLSHLLSIGRLDFGMSAVSGLPALTELAHRLPATLELVGFGAIIAVIIGAPLGIVLSAGRVLRAGAPLMQIVAAAPVFCAGLGLLWLSQRVLHWGGASPNASLARALADGNFAMVEAVIRAAALPALTVGAAGAASVQLAFRRSIGRARGEPYRRGLQAMGLNKFEVDRLYLLPEILGGVLRNLGEIAASLLAASAVAEWVFAWPGAAGLFLKSVALEDWTVVAMVLLAFASLTILAEFVGAIGARALGEAQEWS